MAAALAADPAFGRVTERAKACITANAVEVERAEPSLAGATDFLLGDVCAESIEVRERYQSSAATLEGLRSERGPTDIYDELPSVDTKAAARMKAAAAKQREIYARATINEDTGEISLPPGAEPTYQIAIVGMNGRQPASPDLRAFAAKALLEARKARLARP
jgi:hypothetical protein